MTSSSPDPMKWLWHRYRQLMAYSTGKRGTPQQTRFARLMVLGLGLSCVVPKLIEELGAWMLLPVVVIGLIVGYRVWQRWRW